MSSSSKVLQAVVCSNSVFLAAFCDSVISACGVTLINANCVVDSCIDNVDSETTTIEFTVVALLPVTAANTATEVSALAQTALRTNLATAIASNAATSQYASVLTTVSNDITFNQLPPVTDQVKKGKKGAKGAKGTKGTKVKKAAAKQLVGFAM